MENFQWHNWLLDLLSDSLAKVGDEEWNKKMVTYLVNQFHLYNNSSVEKSFAIKSAGTVLDHVKTDRVRFLFFIIRISVREKNKH